MPAKISCSIGLLTLNSGKYLERCLQSLKDFEDVFLLDGNSTDNTLNIAKEYNIPVYKQFDSEEKNVRIKNFTEMRLKVWALTKCSWVLLLDSDEFLSENLVNEIKEVLEREDNSNYAFNIQKKYIIGFRKIEFCFNYPNYYTRLFRKGSGVTFKKDKAVHEQIFLPPGIQLIKMKGSVYSELPATYRDCVEKDNHQLGLMKKSTFAPGAFKWRGHSLEMGIIYFLRAVKILLKSLVVYIKHGYRRSLPIWQVLRHVRVHLIMSYWRFLQFLYGTRSEKK